MTNEAMLQNGFRLILTGLGLDLESPHLIETPQRAAKAWYHELCKGLTGEPPKITTFPADLATKTGMVVLQHIPIRSICSHHLLPFFGEATIAYISGNHKILGLSKLSRIADYWARRPQVQEELTNEITQHICDLMGVTDEQGGVAVVIKATHMCMVMRGVNHPGAMVTSAMRGHFLHKPQVREEFLAITQNGRSS